MEGICEGCEDHWNCLNYELNYTIYPAQAGKMARHEDTKAKLTIEVRR